MLLYFITGYGMTKGLINPALATRLHLSYLTYIVLAAFAIHTSFAIHLAFKRWGIWNNIGKFSLFLGYLLFVSAFVYIDKFYQKGPSENQDLTASINSDTGDDNFKPEQSLNPSPSPRSTANASPKASLSPKTNTSKAPTTSLTPTPTPKATTNTFTAAQLAKYNGQNGQPAYVAVDGLVYNLSSVFRGGFHQSHFAGKDLTGAFYSQHAKAVLSKYPVVGTLVR